MIRVSKSNNIPRSLQTTKSYNAEDTVLQLSKDSHKKCYLCERKRDTDFNVEHYKSRENDPNLAQKWTNLFFACSNCNGKKKHSFDEILNPLTENIEEIIEQKMDFSNNKALFSVNSFPSPCADKTIELLDRIYNLLSPTEELKKAIQEELLIDKELLGFKYWIIKNNEELFSEFENDMIWNRI